MKEKVAYLELGKAKLIAKMKEQLVVFDVSGHDELWLEGSIFFQLYTLSFHFMTSCHNYFRFRD